MTALVLVLALKSRVVNDSDACDPVLSDAGTLPQRPPA